MKVITAVQDFANFNSDNRAAVFTMGALHAGHVELMKAARSVVGQHGQVVVSIFVNPNQFTDSADLLNYPRTLERDLQICAAAGVNLVFAPSVQEMYPHSIPQFSAGEIGEILEGKSRPGHFDAVATVVARLLDITQPQHTFFGEKDYQQCVVVQNLINQNQLPVRFHLVPTVREESGLALSSRNQRLQNLHVASKLYAAMQLVAAQLNAAVELESARMAGIDMLKAFGEIQVDYLEIRRPDLSEAQAGDKDLRILIAAVVDGVRLIDNLAVSVR